MEIGGNLKTHRQAIMSDNVSFSVAALEQMQRFYTGSYGMTVEDFLVKVRAVLGVLCVDSLPFRHAFERRVQPFVRRRIFF